MGGAVSGMRHPGESRDPVSFLSLRESEATEAISKPYHWRLLRQAPPACGGQGLPRNDIYQLGYPTRLPAWQVKTLDPGFRRDDGLAGLAQTTKHYRRTDDIVWD